MIVKTRVKIGDVEYQLEVDEPKEIEALNKAIAISEIPTYCTICKKKDTKDNFHLTTNKDKENNIYVNLKHNPCGGKVKLGSFKSGGFFWHREFEVYKKESSESEPK